MPLADCDYSLFFIQLRVHMEMNILCSVLDSLVDVPAHAGMHLPCFVLVNEGYLYYSAPFY